LTLFRQRLKTYLFQKSFPDVLLWWLRLRGPRNNIFYSGHVKYFSDWLIINALFTYLYTSQQTDQQKHLHALTVKYKKNIEVLFRRIRRCVGCSGALCTDNFTDVTDMWHDVTKTVTVKTVSTVSFVTPVITLIVSVADVPAWHSLRCDTGTVFVIVTSASALPLRTIKCCSAVFGVTLRLLVINTSSSSPVKNKFRRLPATSICHHLPQSVAAVCIALGGRTVHSTRWSQMFAENRNFSLVHLHSTHSLGESPSEFCHNVCYGKTRMVWLPGGEKIRRYVYSFRQNLRTWQTDIQTDGRTDTAWRRWLRVCIASRGKKNTQTVSLDVRPDHPRCHIVFNFDMRGGTLNVVTVFGFRQNRLRDFLAPMGQKSYFSLFKATVVTARPMIGNCEQRCMAGSIDRRPTSCRSHTTTQLQRSRTLNRSQWFSWSVS